MSLCKDILRKGHTICTDNWYTLLNLAEKLITIHTHLVGTLRKNRRGNPKQVVSQKLKRGEVIARENEKSVTVLKWKDKIDMFSMFFLSKNNKTASDLCDLSRSYSCYSNATQLAAEYFVYIYFHTLLMLLCIHLI